MVSSSSAHWFAPFVLVLFVCVSFNIQVDATAVGGQGEISTQDVVDFQDRLSGIETALSSMFAALPKNEHGHLDRPAVRYVLHRLFVQRYGMFWKGLEPLGQRSNSSSISGILESEVPAHVMGLLEERVGGRGLGIYEVAVLAATLEHVVHDEAIDRLKFAYAALGMSVDQKATEEQVLEAIEVYMVLFVRGINHSAMTLEEVKREQAEIQGIYTTWPVTQEFARGVRRDVIKTASMADSLTFDTTSRVVEEIGQRYGGFQDRECRDLKGALLQQGDQGVGRVLLKDFYKGDVDGTFVESADYLRELGALDESDPARVSVIVPNYINSPNNCLTTASLYKVCCIDECEAILGHLEREISAPDAGPERIIEIVSHLGSASVDVLPRILPSSLVSRLYDVARHHSGRVPLHGRLFSQWLHHAYPRECPYPHVAGTIRPQTAAEWMQEGNSVDASPSEIEKLYEVESRSSAKPKTTAEESLQWEQTEELFVERWSPSRLAAPVRSSWADSCRGFVFLAALAAMGLGFKDTIMSVLLGSKKHSGAKSKMS